MFLLLNQFLSTFIINPSESCFHLGRFCFFAGFLLRTDLPQSQKLRLPLLFCPNQRAAEEEEEESGRGGPARMRLGLGSVQRVRGKGDTARPDHRSSSSKVDPWRKKREAGDPFASETRRDCC